MQKGKGEYNAKINWKKNISGDQWNPDHDHHFILSGTGDQCAGNFFSQLRGHYGQ